MFGGVGLDLNMIRWKQRKQLAALFCQEPRAETPQMVLCPVECCMKVEQQKQVRAENISNKNEFRVNVSNRKSDII